jgi:predicted lysophospholipase L1 biosynthesis ABC-type transport system permease subunit
MLGTKIAGALGLQLGDDVAVGGGRHKLRLRLVGLGVLPATKWGKLGEGAAMRFAALRRIQPATVANAAEIVLAQRANRAATLARLQALAGGPSSAVTPAEVTDFGGVRMLPLLIAGLFAIAAAAALAHALLTSIRRRRRDLAVLKTLGFTRGQVIETIAWQATTVAAVGVLAGLPLGVGVGRFAWHLFATDLGVVPEAVTAFGATALVVPATVLIANLVAALPATTAARTEPARVLRAE